MKGKEFCYLNGKLLGLDQNINYKVFIYLTRREYRYIKKFLIENIKNEAEKNFKTQSFQSLEKEKIERKKNTYIGTCINEKLPSNILLKTIKYDKEGKPIDLLKETNTIYIFSLNNKRLSCFKEREDVYYLNQIKNKLYNSVIEKKPQCIRNRRRNY